MTDERKIFRSSKIRTSSLHNYNQSCQSFEKLFIFFFVLRIVEIKRVVENPIFQIKTLNRVSDLNFCYI